MTCENWASDCGWLVCCLVGWMSIKFEDETLLQLGVVTRLRHLQLGMVSLSKLSSEFP